MRDSQCLCLCGVKLAKLIQKLVQSLSPWSGQQWIFARNSQSPIPELSERVWELVWCQKLNYSPWIIQCAVRGKAFVSNQIWSASVWFLFSHMDMESITCYYIVSDTFIDNNCPKYVTMMRSFEIFDRHPFHFSLNCQYLFDIH